MSSTLRQSREKQECACVRMRGMRLAESETGLIWDHHTGVQRQRWGEFQCGGPRFGLSQIRLNACLASARKPSSPFIGWFPQNAYCACTFILNLPLTIILEYLMYLLLTDTMIATAKSPGILPSGSQIRMWTRPNLGSRHQISAVMRL